MGIFEAIIQGIIQGLTEFLPISSSGHLSVAQHIMGTDIGSETSNLFFTVMLHIGTLIAVLVAYYPLILRLIRELFIMIGDIFTGRFRWKEMSYDRRMLIMLVISTLPLFALFIPVPGTEERIKDYITAFSEDSSILLEGFLFLVTGCLLLTAHCLCLKAELKGNKMKNQLTTGDSLFVGLFQLFATMPAMSRSGSTLSAGIIRGVDRQTAVDFSFVLGIPTIIAANLLEAKEAIEQGVKFELLPIIIGVAFSAAVGFLAIKLLKLLVSKNRLNIFAYYCLAIGVIVLIIGIVEHINGVNLFTGAPLTV